VGCASSGSKGGWSIAPAAGASPGCGWRRGTRIFVLDDHVGTALTAAAGEFTIVFDESRFAGLTGERFPDLFFRIHAGARLLRSTGDAVLCNTRAGTTPVHLEVDMDEAPDDGTAAGAAPVEIRGSCRPRRRTPRPRPPATPPSRSSTASPGSRRCPRRSTSSSSSRRARSSPPRPPAPSSTSWGTGTTTCSSSSGGDLEGLRWLQDTSGESAKIVAAAAGAWARTNLGYPACWSNFRLNDIDDARDRWCHTASRPEQERPLRAAARAQAAGGHQAGGSRRGGVSAMVGRVRRCPAPTAAAAARQGHPPARCRYTRRRSRRPRR